MLDDEGATVSRKSDNPSLSLGDMRPTHVERTRFHLLNVGNDAT